MRNIIILVAVIAIGVGAVFALRQGGLFDRVTEQRVERVLTSNGVPEVMAQCMAPRLVDRLSLEQLEKLERLAPESDEPVLPTSTREALARLRRVDDSEAVRQLASVSAGCAIEVGMDFFGQ